ncbi:MAG: M48 family metallopeptidase [Candidatus Eremiobacteraeota bacterium]|nr:M48 family metallopeptidase [Candidatus Eremiobacteraeota bacterium]MBC5828274.1 M48 family metallopeptidase [Candidatus Eremiobacteraeota bacterium]
MIALPPDIERIVDAVYPLPRQAAAAQLAALERPLFFLGTLEQLAALLLFYYAGGAALLRTRLQRTLSATWSVAASFAVCLVLGITLIEAPVSWLAGFALLHRFGLSREAGLTWLGDFALETALSCVVAAFLAGLLFAAMGRWKRRWPFVAAIAAAPLIVFGNAIYPVYVAPLFNHYTALPPSRLTHAILSLASHEGINASAVYEYDMSRQTTTDNAYVAGIGRTERIAVGDNLLRDLRPDEILYVLAHEMGHYKLGHLWIGTLYGWIGCALAIAVVAWLGDLLAGRCASVCALNDPAALALIAAILSAYALLGMPIGNRLSRGIESAADLYAATHTHLGQAGIRAFARLGANDLTPLHPQAAVVWFFYTHPPLDERIMTAARYAAHAADESLFRPPCLLRAQDRCADHHTSSSILAKARSRAPRRSITLSMRAQWSQ